MMYKEKIQEQYRDPSNLRARINLHVRFSTDKYGFDRWVFDHLKLPNKGKVLELGCGDGSFWANNINRIKTICKIELSDAFAEMLESAHRKLKLNKALFSFSIIDAELTISRPDNYYDVVIAKHMLYHIHNRMRAISEIARILKPHGHLYATTNGINHMKELVDLVAEFDSSITWCSCNAKRFGLENGLEQLARCFSHVTLHRHKDKLVVNEINPLIEYVLSTKGNTKCILVGEKLIRFRKFLTEKMAKNGSIHINKDVGLFIASNHRK